MLTMKSRSKRARRQVAAAMAFALLLFGAGCGGGGGGEEARDTPATGGTPPETAGRETAPGDMAAGATATAEIEGRSDVVLAGRATFTPADGGVRVHVELTGAPPGAHGLHLHQIGDCSAPDATSAGDHFNPGGHQHGGPDMAERHAGDFGNIMVGQDGTGHLELVAAGLTIDSGPNGVVGRAVVVHANPDDLTSQPAGNAGARIGCGVVSLGQTP
jgi:Cu-Zn family superoxide dismutase